MEDDEIWKDVCGYVGIAQVSNYGRVRTLNRTYVNSLGVKKLHQGRMMTPSTDKWGYKYVNLSIGGKSKKMKVHRLVAQAFIDNPKSLPCVNHKNEIKHDNLESNLEWASYRYNKVYSIDKRSTTSSHVGVSWHKALNCWRAYFNIGKKQTHLGYFDDESDAAKAYIDFSKKNKQT